MTDHADPAVRAEARRQRAEARERTWRAGVSLTLALTAAGLCATAVPITGKPGAIVGAGVIAILALLLVWALWPWHASEQDRRHRELSSIWHTVRVDADKTVEWERYCAWAQAAGDTVELQLIRCAPAHARVAGAPSPYSRQLVRRLDAEDIAAAAAAMEELRAHAAAEEQRARERTEQAHVEAARRDHNRRLHAIDTAAQAELDRHDAQLRAELAQQEAAERRAQAEAVARALRRP